MLILRTEAAPSPAQHCNECETQTICTDFPAQRECGGAVAPSPAPQAPGNNYVQPVPDHCDRIVWRGFYYGLPLTPGVPAVPRARRPTNAEVAQWAERHDLRGSAGDLRDAFEDAQTLVPDGVQGISGGEQ